MKTASITVFLVGLSLFIGCSSSTELSSRWHIQSGEDSVNGGYYFQEQKFAVDVQNDNEFLYLSFSFGDRITQRQIARFGLTVWFDYQGGEEKRFGTHYPLPDFSTLTEMRHSADEPTDTSWALPEKLPDDLDIFGPQKDEHHRVKIVDAKGIDIKIRNMGGTEKYLMKIPLMDNGSHTYAIGAQPGGVLGIGIESGNFSNTEQGERPGFGSGEGSGGSTRGGGRRGMGRMPGGDGSRGTGERREPLHVWLKTHLAQSGTGATQ